MDRLDALKNELKQKHNDIDIHTLKLDVRRKKNVQEAVASLPASVKNNIDVLVNNAGLVVGMEPLINIKEEDYDTMMDTNVKGLMFLTQAILPGMIEREKGHIINVGSVAGKQKKNKPNKYKMDIRTWICIYKINYRKSSHPDHICYRKTKLS